MALSHFPYVTASFSSSLETKCIPYGRQWHKSKRFAVGWDSECGRFGIMPVKDRQWLLIAFEHETETGGEWNRRFPTVEDAMEFAERM